MNKTFELKISSTFPLPIKFVWALFTKTLQKKLLSKETKYSSLVLVENVN